MNTIKRLLGFLWASPVTTVALLYVLLFEVMDWYTWGGVKGDAFVWFVNPEKAPAWLMSLWKSWAGQTIGNVVVLRYPTDTRLGAITLTHEQVHVAQGMRLGIFQPIMYGAIYLTIKLACRNAHPYYDNSFEIDARRGAGQVIDVVGAVAKAAAEGRLPLKK
jgi:hypothetical protein